MGKAIALISGKDPVEELGGHSSYVRAHAWALRRAGFEPHIFCAHRRSSTYETDFGIIHRTASPFRSVRSVMLPLQAPFIAACVERFLLSQTGPQLIHSFGPWGYIGVTVSRRLRLRGIEVTPIVSVYTTMEHEAHGKLEGLTDAHGRLRYLQHRAESMWIALTARYERQMCLQSRLVIANYDSVLRLVLAKYGSAVRFRKLPYTLESAFWHDSTVNPAGPNTVATPQSIDAPLIVAVSRHDARKGLDILLQALARLRTMGIRFRASLIGGGSLLDAHRRLAARLGIEDVTTIEGWVTDSFGYLQQADVFVLPSLEEGSGSLSLIEALHAGVAVVASNVDGIPEDVVDGESALLVGPGDVTALSHAIAQVITNLALRQKLARCARETFAEKFSAEALTNALRETYAELGFQGTYE